MQDFVQDEALLWMFSRVCGQFLEGAGSCHLVSRHCELLELCMKLWVASWGGGKFGLSSWLPIRKESTNM